MLKPACLVVLLLLVVLSACKTQRIIFPPPVIEEPAFTDFCELPAHQHQLIYTRAVCRRLGDRLILCATDKKCGTVTAKLYLPDDLLDNPARLKILRKLRFKLNNDYLIMDIIGEIEQEGDAATIHGVKEKGYPDYKLVVKCIEGMYLVKEKAPGNFIDIR